MPSDMRRSLLMKSNGLLPDDAGDRLLRDRARVVLLRAVSGDPRIGADAHDDVAVDVVHADLRLRIVVPGREPQRDGDDVDAGDLHGAGTLYCIAMKLIGIEPTPNPNSMKLVLDETLAPGVKATYRAGDEVSAPLMRDLMSIAGVAGLFHTSDFMAVQRTPGTDWQEILTQVRTVFEAAAGGVSAEVSVPRTEGATQELLVSMQVFRDIPMLVKVTGGGTETRRGLGRRFDAAAKRAMPAARNPLMERHWVELGTRYGDAEEVADNVVAEVRALYDSDRLAWLTDRALSSDQDEPEARPDRQRLIRRSGGSRLARTLSGAPKASGQTPSCCPGSSRSPVTLTCRCAGRRSCCWGWSRTRGRWLLSATRWLTRSLRSVEPRRRCAQRSGQSRGRRRDGRDVDRRQFALVRWRAARFLFELGDERSLPSLRAARDDRVFEVRMQIEQAIERIESGARPEGPVWQRMTRGGRGP